jgi:glyoxylase-like metal-dependent hydrolase (beta-lactamase superfamily II)
MEVSGVSVQFTIINLGTLSMNKFWGETERVRPATATCVLLESEGRRLLVDPSPGPDELEPMLYAQTGLRPAGIDAVFLTHFHGDHRYGLELFGGATWWMAEPGLQEWQARNAQDATLIERFVAAEAQLLEGIRLLPSPGHTFGHHSLQVDSTWGPLIVAGDAVMTREFFEAEEGFHNCVDFELATQTIHTIKERADWVIPGHGNLLICPR